MEVFSEVSFGALVLSYPCFNAGFSLTILQICLTYGFKGMYLKLVQQVLGLQDINKGTLYIIGGHSVFIQKPTNIVYDVCSNQAYIRISQEHFNTHTVVFFSCLLVIRTVVIMYSCNDSHFVLVLIVQSSTKNITLFIFPRVSTRFQKRVYCFNIKSYYAFTQGLVSFQ